MNKHRPMENPSAASEGTMSLIGSGTSIVGHCKARGSVQIEGRVEGSVESQKTVSIGKDGVVIGDITTQDAVIAGRIQGRLTIGSLVQLQASCDVGGEIDTRRILIEEGATVNATVRMSNGRSQPSSK